MGLYTCKKLDCNYMFLRLSVSHRFSKFSVLSSLSGEHLILKLAFMCTFVHVQKTFLSRMSHVFTFRMFVLACSKFCELLSVQPRLSRECGQDFKGGVASSCHGLSVRVRSFL